MSSIAVYLSPRMLMILALGFTSGLPLGLTGSNLSTWLFEEGIDIKLVGDFIDALTLSFAGARFTAGTGQKARFDVDYLGHKVGPALEFVEQLSEILNPGSGSGPYLRPTASPIGKTLQTMPICSATYSQQWIVSRQLRTTKCAPPSATSWAAMCGCIPS